MSDLPPGWKAHTGADGKTFYHNETTKESSWEKPSANHDPTADLPPGWTAHTGADGKTFYHNETTKESSWEKPSGSKVSGAASAPSPDQVDALAVGIIFEFQIRPEAPSGIGVQLVGYVLGCDAQMALSGLPGPVWITKIESTPVIADSPDVFHVFDMLAGPAGTLCTVELEGPAFGVSVWSLPRDVTTFTGAMSTTPYSDGPNYDSLRMQYQTCIDALQGLRGQHLDNPGQIVYSDMPYPDTSTGSLKEMELQKLLSEWKLTDVVPALSERGIRSVDMLIDADFTRLKEKTKMQARQAAKLEIFVTHQKNMQFLQSFEPPSESKSESETERKFVARKLVMGNAKASAGSLERTLGVDRETLMVKGLDAIQAEWEKSGSKEDQDNFQYVRYGTAGDVKNYPEHMQEQIRTRKYHGGALEDPESDIDFGHKNMTLKDFMSDKHAKIAELSEEEVLCLRLYTSSSFPCFITPLRDEIKPHPFALSVYHLSQGLKKLREVAATLDEVGFMKEKMLYRGMKDVELDEDKFLSVGGTEMAPMSTTSQIEVAAKYAASKQPLLFVFKTQGINRGVDIQFLSIYPKEVEYLYPPLTQITPTSEESTTVGNFRVLTVTPMMN